MTKDLNQELDEIVEKYSQSGEISRLKARIKELEGEVQKPPKSREKSSRRPGEANHNYWRGRFFQENNKYKRAVHYYKKAAELDPSVPLYPYSVGILLFNMNKYTDAIPYLKKTVRLDPGYEAAQEILKKCYNRKDGKKLRR
jgi:tetratricopeptide (TPR) repeat protein